MGLGVREIGRCCAAGFECGGRDREPGNEALEAERQRSSASGWRWPRGHLVSAQWHWLWISGFQNCKRISVLSHQVCGNWLQKPMRQTPSPSWSLFSLAGWVLLEKPCYPLVWAPPPPPRPRPSPGSLWMPSAALTWRLLWLWPLLT